MYENPEELIGSPIMTIFVGIKEVTRINRGILISAFPTATPRPAKYLVGGVTYPTIRGSKLYAYRSHDPCPHDGNRLYRAILINPIKFQHKYLIGSTPTVESLEKFWAGIPLDFGTESYSASNVVVCDAVVLWDEWERDEKHYHYGTPTYKLFAESFDVP